MSESFSDFLIRSQRRCQYSRSTLLGEPLSEFVMAAPELEQLFSAGQYSLTSGGKCIRASLVYAAAHIQEGDGSADDTTLDYVACAVEMIHTYSLVHDDLPAMDDDDFRRGRPSCHKAFGEAIAILVGDALQCRAFELLVDAPGLTAEQKVSMVKTLSAAAGPRGMVGGQAMDITVTDTHIGFSQLQSMHALKTGALIRASLALGGCAVGASVEQLAALDDYGRDIGLAFQVIDDILDVEGDTDILGKTQGKDGNANKPTYVKLMGLKGAKDEAQRLQASALAALDIFGGPADHLREMAKLIVNRDH